MTGVPSYSTTPSENVQANTGINWDEGMPPAAVNNSARQNMTDMRLQWNDASWFQYGTGSKNTVLPAYASATTFTIAGVDVTTYYHVGRRVKAVGSSTGTIYGTISATAFSTNTTVTVIWDSGSLSNETLTIYAGTIQATGSPVPASAISGSLVVPSHLSGLALSAAGSTATFGVAAGVAADSTNAGMLTLASAYTKTTGSWSVGSGNGSLDTGTIANATWYHVWLIKRVDTGVVDILTSTSASSPTMPSNYTLKRRIGAMLTDSSAQWVAFVQTGDLFEWKAVPSLNQNGGLTAATATLIALTVPLGLAVEAVVDVLYNGTSGNGVYVWNPALGTGGLPAISSVGGTSPRATARVYTNTSKQAYFQADDTSLVRIETRGWIDRRGRDG